MYIPTFQGLTPNDFVRAAGSGRSRFPFDVPHLSFYRARNAIYYLFRALKSTNDTLTVLVPDYNSGNEVLALEAAGATVHYYAVGPDGQADPAEVERLCAAHHPDVLYVIHYLGWPQPVQPLAALCRATTPGSIPSIHASITSSGTSPGGTANSIGTNTTWTGTVMPPPTSNRTCVAHDRRFSGGFSVQTNSSRRIPPFSLPSARSR